jgi:hypothetical protein
MAIHYPPVFINEYLKEEVSAYFRSNPFQNQVGDLTIPFFPTLPTDIDSLTQTLPDGNGMFAVYDRMFKMRRSPFPHIKCEQLLYYFYKTVDGPAALIETAQVVHDLLDRGDESAQELNRWIREYQLANPGDPILPAGVAETSRVSYLANPDNPRIPTARFAGKDFLLPFFHEIKVYQLEETRDIIDFGTARTYAGNKMIIDYDWHK